jgi:hypothetical protein
MSADGFARVRACFENAIEIPPIAVPKRQHTISQRPSQGALPQIPQTSEMAEIAMTVEEDAFEERAAIIEFGGGFPRPLAEFLAKRGIG